jgi:glucosamine 6-phosphate synthetase-like amidotransferase/phosphosugar isomerase protein
LCLDIILGNGTRDINATTPAENSMLSLLKKMNYSGYDKLVNALNTAIQTLETAKNSGKSFVEEPGAQRVKNCIDAVSALDEELNNAGSWINLQDAI